MTITKLKNSKSAHPHSPWKAVIHLLTHLVIGVVLFIAIALVALGLGLFVKQVEAWGAAPFVVGVLVAVEYFLLLADACLFVYLVGKSIYKTAKEMEL